MPRSESEKGIGTEQTEEHIGGLELAAQALQGIKSVVELSVGKRRIHAASNEPGFSCHSQPNHGQPIFKTGVGRAALERLGADGCDQHLVKRQPADGGTGDRDMATMRRIKCAPKEGDAHRASYRDGCSLGPLRCLPLTLLSAPIWGTGRKPWPPQADRSAGLGRVAAALLPSLYEVPEPVGFRDQPAFLNAVLALETKLEPVALLHALLGHREGTGPRSHSECPQRPPHTGSRSTPGRRYRYCRRGADTAPPRLGATPLCPGAAG